jgi:hypothetical protein
MNQLMPAEMTDADCKASTAAWSNHRSKAAGAPAAAGAGLAAGGLAQAKRVAGLGSVESDSQAGAAVMLPTAAMATDISTDALKKLVHLAKSCPYDRDTYDTMLMNCGGGRQMLTRHTVSPAAARFPVYREFRENRVDANGGDSAKERQWRITLAQKAVWYVIGTLVASFISDNAEFRKQKFLPWLLDNFWPACASILLEESATLLNPLTEAMESHGLNPPAKKVTRL